LTVLLGYTIILVIAHLLNVLFIVSNLANHAICIVQMCLLIVTLNLASFVISNVILWQHRHIPIVVNFMK